MCFQIFTEDLPEVESLPRSPILTFLENISKTNRTSKDLAIPYLVSIKLICILLLLKILLLIIFS